MIERFLFKPLSGEFVVTQKFGENNACVNQFGKVVGITPGGTCPAGYAPLYQSTKGHNGIDVRAKRWQPVYAAHSGIVTEVQTEEARGLGVGITKLVTGTSLLLMCIKEIK
jgi:murein DD-endopeptidase MepM/ murein hydrolase activator NlpD